MSSKKYVRVPPDSAGKRIQHDVTLLVEYSSGTTAFKIGDKVVGQSSQVRGEIGRVINGSTTVEGSFYLVIELDSDENLTVGETLLVDGVPYAQVANSTPLYSQRIQIVGGTNTTNVVNIDDRGAIYTRSADGSNLYDAFGKLEVSQNTTIGEYSFQYDKLPEEIYYEMVGNASIGHQPRFSGILLSCDTTSGDSAIGTTHLYHKYQASVSQHVGMSVSIGDAGKDNVVRRWGYFDQEDGMFFERDGQTLNVVIRSSATGQIEELRIPQSQWNGDRLNGEGGTFNLSRYALDPTTLFLWWIDFHWYGAGVVRFGIQLNGKRIVCHQTSSEDRGGLPFIRKASLPIRFEQFNTDTSISISEMRVVEASVNTTGRFLPKYKSFGIEGEIPPLPISSNSFVPLFSGRLKQEFKGSDNRTVALPRDISAYVMGNGPIEVQIIKNGTLAGDTWTIDAGAESAVEIDATASSITGGRLVWKDIIGPNTKEKMDLTPVFNFEQGDTVKRHANIEDYDTFTLLARIVIPGGDPVNASFVLTVSEIQ